MAVIEIEGRKVEVDDSFKSLSPEQQAATVDEIAQSMNIQAGSETGAVENFMSQLNRGIAQGAGGVIDLLNPFDEQTGSAVTGLETAMTAIGAPPADRPPETLMEGFAAGTGEAAALFGPAVAALKGLSLASNPLVKGLADDALTAMLTKVGLGTEVAAGGISGAAGEAAQQADAGPGVEMLARLAAPVGVLAAAPAAGRAILGTSASVATGVPFVGTAIKAGARQVGDIRRSLTPQTEAAATETAATRLRTLVGGEERATELGRRIEVGDEFGLSAARQTEDPVLLGLERAAKSEDPLARERLDLRETQARELAGEEIGKLGGDVPTAQTLFQRRVNATSARMQDKIDQEISQATESVEATGPRVSETQASLNVVESVKAALAEELVTENRLWAAVPKRETVPVAVSRETAEQLVASTPRAQQGDIPPELRLLTGDDGFGNAETAAELHGLYSKLRQTAREASSGQAPNNNKARIANEVADSILMDLGAVNPETPLGDAINAARVFSRALHEKFDTGAVGKMLNQNQQGAETLTPEAALRGTVKPGPEGVAAAKSITGAAPQAREDVSEFLRGQYLDSAFDASGTFSPKRAKTWMRNNRELLNQFPEMRAEINRSLTSRKNADVFAARTAARQALVENESAAARFALAPPEKAAMTIIGARDPVVAARSIMASAAKDPTLFSADGVKGALTDYLVAGGTRADGLLAGDKLRNLMTDKKLRGALKEVFTPDELKRLDEITTAVSKFDPRDERAVSEVLDNPTNKILEFVVTTFAARHGAKLGAGTSGASLKTASAASNRAKQALRNLTNSKAREILMDAIQDPALMKALLATPETFISTPALRSKMAPYLVGGAATVGDNQPLEVPITPAGNFEPETPEETQALDEQIRQLTGTGQ